MLEPIALPARLKLQHEKKRHMAPANTPTAAALKRDCVARYESEKTGASASDVK
jgi:hypothetical protein